jgi:signal peptidase
MRYLKRLPSAAVAVVLVVWFVLFRPVAFGGPAGYEVVTGKSMEPLLHTGDLVVTQSQAAYGVGDLIVFHVPSGQPGAGSSVIHRIVGGDGIQGFTVKGDNKPAPDSWHPKASDIIGRSWIELPGSGAWLLVLRRPLVLAAIIGGLAGFWIFTSGSGSSSTPRGEGGSGLMAWRRRRKNALQGEVVEQ